MSLALLVGAGFLFVRCQRAVRRQRPEPAADDAADDWAGGPSDEAMVLVEAGQVARLTDAAREMLGPVIGEPVAAALAGALHDPDEAVAAAVAELERTGEPVCLLTGDRTGRLLELHGRPVGGQLCLTLRQAGLIAERLAAAEAAVAAREAALGERTRQEQTLAALLAAAPIIVWNRDPAGRLNWSGGTIGTPAGTADATTVMTMLAARAAHAQDGAAAPDGIEKSRIDIALPGGDGLPLHVVELPGPDGTILGYAVDATMASSAERTLSRFVQTMTETFAHLTVGLAIFDRNQTLAMFNPTLAQIWQVEPSWLACRPSLKEIIEQLRTRRRMPEVQDFHDWRARLLALFDDTEQADYEAIWHLEDDSSIRVLAKPHPHGSLAFVFDDVTDRVKLEQRYRHSIDLRRSTLDRVDEGLAVFGPDGLLQFVNTAFHEIWGTEPATLGQTRHAREVVELCRASSVETEAWDRLLAFVTADDVRRPWSTRLTLGSGRVLSLRIAALPDGSSMVVFADITDSERIALALRERNEALEAAEEMRTAVLDQISHRLRTPLSTIFGFGQLLSDPRFGPLSERQRGYASGILEAAGHLLDTIDDVTELAALQIDPLHDEGTSHLVWETLAMTREVLQKRAIEAGARLVLADMPVGAEHLACDLPTLRQIVFSLAADALHRADRGRRIALGARATDDGALEIFSVETGGAGATPPQRSELSSLTRSLIQRQTEQAGGSFALQAGEAPGDVVAVCRFPAILGRADPPFADDEDDDALPESMFGPGIEYG